MKFVDAKNDIAFRRIFGNEQKEELIAYDNASIAEQDERGKLIAAENKGKIEGKIEEKEEVIKRCLEENMTAEMISKIVNLPISEVNNIIASIIGDGT